MIIKQFTAEIDASGYKDINSMAFLKLLRICKFDESAQVKGSKERKEAYDKIIEWDCFPTDLHYGYVERLPKDSEDKMIRLYLIPSNMGIGSAHEWNIVQFRDVAGWEDKILDLLETIGITEHTFNK